MSQETTYPKWKYHKKDGSVLLKSAAEEALIGKGWEDSPASFKDADETHYPEMKLDPKKLKELEESLATPESETAPKRGKKSEN